MKKLRIGAMAITVAVGVGAFIGAQRMAWIPGPWSKDQLAIKYLNRSMNNLSAAIDDPKSYMDYYHRGLSYQKQQQLEEALAAFYQAVKLSPKAVSAAMLGENAFNSGLPETHTLNMVFLIRTTRAEILRQMNRPAEAIADLDEALLLDARSENTFYARALLHTFTGRYDTAIADFDTILNRRTDATWLFGLLPQRGVDQSFGGFSSGRAHAPARRFDFNMADESHFARRRAAAAAAFCLYRQSQPHRIGLKCVHV